MVKLLQSIVLIAGVVLFAANANAQRQPVPIIDHENIQFTTGKGVPLSIDEVKNAITVGAGAGKRVWTVSNLDGNRLLATYNVRTHSISVNISYTEKSYSIKYANSVNMKYGTVDGARVIHPFYNRWVDELMASIAAEFAKH